MRTPALGWLSKYYEYTVAKQNDEYAVAKQNGVGLDGWSYFIMLTEGWANQWQCTDSCCLSSHPWRSRFVCIATFFASRCFLLFSCFVRSWFIYIPVCFRDCFLSITSLFSCREENLTFIGRCLSLCYLPRRFAVYTKGRQKLLTCVSNIPILGSKSSWLTGC